MPAWKRLAGWRLTCNISVMVFPVAVIGEMPMTMVVEGIRSVVQVAEGYAVELTCRGGQNAA